MPQHTRQYHWLSCSAKIANLLNPTCTTISEADFGDVEDVTQKALDTGWSRTPNGKDVLCPQHAAEPAVKAPRKARAVPEQGAAE